MRLLIALVFGLTACGSSRPPLDVLPGYISTVTVNIIEGRQGITDWAEIRRDAFRNGYFRQRVPQSSNKPSNDEIAAAKRIEASNDAYEDYLDSPDVRARTQERAIPLLEEALKTSATRAAAYEVGQRFEIKKLNSEEGAPLELKVDISTAVFSTEPDASGSAAGGDGQNYSLPVLAPAFTFIGNMTLIDETSGQKVRKGKIFFINGKIPANLKLEKTADLLWFIFSR